MMCVIRWLNCLKYKNKHNSMALKKIIEAMIFNNSTTVTLKCKLNHKLTTELNRRFLRAVE